MHDLVAKFIQISPILGISNNTLFIAAEQSGNLDDIHKFNNDIKDFLSFMQAYIATKAIKRANLLQNSISGKIQDLVWNRLIIYSEFINFRDFLKKEIRFASNPYNVSFYTAQSWKVSDLFWHAIDDHSTNINFYTKRLTLCALNSAALLKFTSDWSWQFEDTHRFLKNRIKNIVQFAQFKARIKKLWRR